VAKVQDPAFGLVESHPIGFSPANQPGYPLGSLRPQGNSTRDWVDRFFFS